MTTVTVACPFQSSVCVQTEDRALLKNLRLKYGQYLLDGDNNKAEFRLCEQENGKYKAIGDGKTIEVDSSLNYISAFLTRTRTFSPKILALHGAAVAYGGNAYLFLAPTTGGKTTLTAWLTERGADYITDDCILINRETLEVYPCTTPIHLRTGGVTVLREQNALPEGLEHLDAPGFERWVFTPKNRVSGPVPLGKIYFLSRTDQNRHVPLSSNDAFIRLLKSPMTEYPVTPSHLQIMSRLTTTAPCELQYRDMTFPEEVLRNKSHA